MLQVLRLKVDKMTTKELKEKVIAFETLFDCQAMVTVQGNWYGPINGNESPEYSLNNHNNYFVVTSIGRKYIEIKVGQYTHKVKISEERGSGAKTFVFHQTKDLENTVEISGAKVR